MTFWHDDIIIPLENLLNYLKAKAQSAVGFLLTFFKELVTEEEAALFPKFKEQVDQILVDVAKTAGLTVKERVALAVAEATADLAVDLVIAKNALFHSWAWAIAHEKGLKDGNQGDMPAGNSTGS